MNKDKIKALALDLYNRNIKRIEMENGESVDANDALRKLLLDKCNGALTYRNFKKIENEFYEILEVLITENTRDLSREMFEPIMDFKDTDYGVKPEFMVENGDLFKVSIVANGHNNLVRQRIHNRRVETTPFNLGVATYTELDAFLLGRIDWKKMVDRIVASFNHEVATLIAKMFNKAYDTLSSGEFKVEGAMDSEKILELVEKVGDGAVIYGTKLALSKLPTIQGFDLDSNDKRNNGYIRMFNGIPCVELENHYDDKEKEFILPNDTLFIIPGGTKVLYGGYEGDAMIREVESNNRVDNQLEFYYTRRVHLGVHVATRFGAYKVNA